jgi:hypothetical protein
MPLEVFFSVAFNHTCEITICFALHKIPRLLVISVSFPDVVGTFAPTVSTTLVHAILAFRIAKITTLTHK